MKKTPLLPPLLLLLLLAGCTGEAPPAAADKPKKGPPPHLVETVTAERARLAPEAVRTGTLRARREVRIYTREEGRVDELPYFEGDRVAAGDLLARLDRSLLAVELEKARAQRRQAELDLARLEGLNKKRLAAEDDLARARTALQVARAEEALLTTRLGYTEIRASWAGVVTERLVEPGDIAPRHSHLLTLMDPDSLITEVPVSELLLPALAVGDAVAIRIDALGDHPHPGRITRIHPTLDPRTRLGRVELTLEPVPEGALPGQLCRVTLAGREAERLVVPFAALRRDGEGEHLYLVDGEGKAQRRAVHSGLRLADRVEITEGLEPGERVIVRGFLGLNPGKAVVPVGGKADEAAPASGQ